jgi:phosphatidylglycerol:prolipoprotein diacylglycerol transferase
VSPRILGGFWSYPLFLGLAVLVGSAVSVWRAWCARLPLARFVAAQGVMAGAAVLGAKLYALAERGGSFNIDSMEMLGGGYRYPGGLLLAAGALLWSSRLLLRGVSLGEVADVIAPGIGIAMAVARVGCFLGGCCFGIPTSLPWGVRFPQNSAAWTAHRSLGLIPPDALSSAPVHPLQLYMLMASAAAALCAIWWDKRKSFPGQTALVFVLAHETSRAALELLRAPVAGVWPWKLAAISVTLGALSGLSLLIVPMLLKRGRSAHHELASGGILSSR